MQQQVVIHGHFYQPPRELPETLRIPFQPTAATHHDWNQRILAECYAANCESPVLHSSSAIAAVINNYAWMSFDFGPTLLTYIARQLPELVEALVEADRASATRLGFGNALAHVYNHAIMPLATAYERRIQIELGIADFQRVFGRDPDGMWLAETAINDAVAADLAAAGMKFVVLAPYQGMPKAAKAKLPELAAQMEAGRPYILKTAKGDLAAFLYHEGVSRSIAFQHLLKDSQAFENALISPFGQNPQHFATIACTDGESYGHHEAFGDMALAALIQRHEAKGPVQLTNFAALLKANPPKDEITLAPGPDQQGTAWSCAHGVGRWQRDCGCRTAADTNQAWRGPLRAGFREFAEAIDGMAAEVFSAAKWPFDLAAREFLPVLANPSKENWAKFKSDPRYPKDERTAWNFNLWLRISMERHYLFTSCAWFFDDIAGIEATQNLTYAAHITDLLKRLSPPIDSQPLLQALEKTLSTAISNKRGSTGQLITGKEVINDGLTNEAHSIPMLLAYLLWRNPAVVNKKLPDSIPDFTVLKTTNVKPRDAIRYLISLFDQLTGTERTIDIEVISDAHGLPLLRWLNHTHSDADTANRFEQSFEMVLDGAAAATFEFQLTEDEHRLVDWEWSDSHALVGILAADYLRDQSMESDFTRPRIWQWETAYRERLRRAALLLSRGDWPVDFERDLVKAKHYPLLAHELYRARFDLIIERYLIQQVPTIDQPGGCKTETLLQRIFLAGNAGVRPDLHNFRVHAFHYGHPIDLV